jgi:membrane protein DedA with SNARE-associated domain
VIVLAANAIVLAVLVATWWAIEHLHLPMDLLHTLAAHLVGALVIVIVLADLIRFRARRTRTTTPGDTR